MTVTKHTRQLAQTRLTTLVNRADGDRGRVIILRLGYDEMILRE